MRMVIFLFFVWVTHVFQNIKNHDPGYHVVVKMWTGYRTSSKNMTGGQMCKVLVSACIFPNARDRIWRHRRSMSSLVVIHVGDNLTELLNIPYSIEKGVTPKDYLWLYVYVLCVCVCVVV